MEQKSLLEFIKALDQLNGANLLYLTGRNSSHYKIDEKYRSELIQVMDLINGFDFVKNHPINPLLLSHPMAEEIWKIFGKENCPPACRHEKQGICMDKKTEKMKRDTCPRCLDRRKEVFGDILYIKKEGDTHSTYKFMCPECEHLWDCSFLKDKK